MKRIITISGQICLVGGLFSYLFIHKNKYTDRYQLILVPEWFESILGKIAKGSITEHKRIKVDSPLFHSIETLCNILLSDINIHKTWTLTILDDDVINAFVLPDGSIYIYTGLLKIFDNIDEAAFVISHELSHVLLRHGSEKLSIQGIMEFIYFLIRIYITGSMEFSGLGNLLVNLPLSRTAELEADFEASEIMRKLGFNLSGAISLLEKLGAHENKDEIWSSHPVSSHRVDEIKQVIRKNPQVISTLKDHSELQKAFIKAKMILEKDGLTKK